MSNELKAEYDVAIAAFNIACIPLSELFMVSTAVKAHDSEYDAAIVAYDVALAEVKATRNALRSANAANAAKDKAWYAAYDAAAVKVAIENDAAWAAVVTAAQKADAAFVLSYVAHKAAMDAVMPNFNTSDALKTAAAWLDAKAKVDAAWSVVDAAYVKLI